MASLFSNPSTTVPSSTNTASHHHHHHRHHRSIRSSLTREDLLAMARNEYARQLCKFTEAQLKQRVPSCYTNSAYKRRINSNDSSSSSTSSSNNNNSISSEQQTTNSSDSN